MKYTKSAALASAALLAVSLAACDTQKTTGTPPAITTASESANPVEASSSSETGLPSERSGYYGSFGLQTNGEGLLSDDFENEMYITALHNEGLVGNEDQYIAAGREVCDLLKKGKYGSTIQAYMVEGLIQFPAPTAYDQGFASGLAVSFMCNEYSYEFGL